MSDRGKWLRRGLVAVLLVAVVPFVVTAVPQAVGAEESYVVLSGSMEPTMSAGDVVVVNAVAPSAIERGDVITFRDDRQRVTHRVVNVTQEDGQRQFVTKGDANEEADMTPVAAESVVGRVAVVLPFIGHIVLFAQTRVGIAALVLVPAALLLATELRSLVGMYRDRDGETAPEPTTTGED
jgi:signal peptidase